LLPKWRGEVNLTTLSTVLCSKFDLMILSGNG
jgi:hypothetical protein